VIIKQITQYSRIQGLSISDAYFGTAQSRLENMIEDCRNDSYCFDDFNE